MNFDAVAIRRLYYDMIEQVERFDKRTALDDVRQHDGINLDRIIRYNVQNCYAMYHLIQNTDFFDCAIIYARHFAVPVVAATHMENSTLFPNAIVFGVLRDRNLTIPFRNTDLCTSERRERASRRSPTSTSATHRPRRPQEMESSRHRTHRESCCVWRATPVPSTVNANWPEYPRHRLTSVAQILPFLAIIHPGH